MSAGKFEVAIRWPVEEGVEVDLVVTGTAERSSGNRRGHPDTWTEAYTELEDLKVENKKGCPLPPAVVGRLLASNAFLKTIEEILDR